MLFHITLPVFISYLSAIIPFPQGVPGRIPASNHSPT